MRYCVELLTKAAQSIDCEASASGGTFVWFWDPGTSGSHRVESMLDLSFHVKQLIASVSKIWDET